MKKEEIIEKYGIEEYKRRLEQNRLRAIQYYQNNADHVKEYQKQWRKDNAEYQKQWYKENADYFKDYVKEYMSNTQQGRANALVQAYKQSDSERNRGECTITSKWLIEHIFNSKCIYCGETDWKKLGCDRINNSLPHTEDNVVCSCGKCNVERQKMKFEEFLKYKKAS